MSNIAASLVMMELNRGKVSIGVRAPESSNVLLLDGWQDLESKEASRIVVDIVQGRITAQEVGAKTYQELALPSGYWDKLEGK